MDFQDKTIVITGGATGIGRSFAKQFGKRGCRVLIGGIRQDRVDEAVAELSALGYETSGTLCDVRDRAQVEALAEHAWQTYGSVDVILNNAGVPSAPSSVIDATREDVDRVLETNLFGVWNGVSVFGKRLIQQGTPAAILNVGSENSFFNAVPRSASYVISKHGVFALTEALREEVPEFIQVALICPGLTISEMVPGFRLGMDTDRFTDLAMAQIEAGEFYVVSHAHNMVRIEERQGEIQAAYARYAPRYDGDDEWDVRKLLAKHRAG